MNIPNSLFSNILGLPEDAAKHELNSRIRSAAGQLATLQTSDCAFDLIAFADAGGCELLPGCEGGHWEVEWRKDRPESFPVNAVLQVRWQDLHFSVVLVTMDCNPEWVIVGNSIVECEKFFSAVCRWNASPDNSFVVFDRGRFFRDDALREQIRMRTFDRLSLPNRVLDPIENQLMAFFEQRELFERLNLTWKRGAIFYGPPGNGKSLTLQALINRMEKPVIYVRSLKTSRWDGITEHECLRRIFARARQIAPCVVVWEDIDSLITDENRAAFLNEMDGFRGLEGVLTLATTNHLEKLDEAISNRPNRFDVKIHFEKPNREEIEQYFKFCGEKWGNNGPSESGLKEAAAYAKGLSYAHLQEAVRCAAVLQLSEIGLDQALLKSVQQLSGRSEEPKKKKSKAQAEKGR